jgi:hypothetical protein
MPRPLSILDLPVKIRELICEYAGFTGFTRDLNYVDLPIYPKNEYPRTEYVETVWCSHDTCCEITRREDYHTLEEYWEAEDEASPPNGNIAGTTCEAEGCEMSDACYQWAATFFYDNETHPELFRIMMQKNHLRICQGSPGGLETFFGDMSRWVEIVNEANLQVNTDTFLKGKRFDEFVQYYLRTQLNRIPKRRRLYPKVDAYVAWSVLQQLGTLTVRLDGEPPESIKLGGYPDENGHYKSWDWVGLDRLIPYNLRSRYGKSAMKQWVRFLDGLACCLPPDSLTLYVITNAPDVETAAAILKPLERLPTLKGCGLFLNLKANEELLNLAETTVRRLTTPRTSTDVAPFRYLDLPQELRYKILENSDLISKADLEWKPRLSDDCTINDAKVKQKIKDRREGDRNYEYHHAKHCCNSQTCGCFPSYRGPCRKDYGGFCVCYLNCEHSAYTSTIRRARKGPHPLFLVSRQVRQDAIPVFFRNNRFVITRIQDAQLRSLGDIFYSRTRSAFHVRRRELSVFLSVMHPLALRHLRYLEWSLPSTPRPAKIDDYLQAIDVMADAMNLPRLTLVMNLRGFHSPDNDYYEDDDFRAWDVRRKSTKTNYYDTILKPLRRLKGLKDCFIYLMRLKSQNLDRSKHWDCIFDSDEVRYEKAIMGPDYDSRRRGKPWIERYERGVYDTPCVGRYAHYRDWEE